MKHTTQIIISLLSLALFGTPIAHAQRPPKILNPYQIIVKYKESPSTKSMSANHKIANIGNQAGLKVDTSKPMANGAYVITLDKNQVNAMSMDREIDPKELMERTLKKLQNDPNILYAVQDQIMHTHYNHHDQWDELATPNGVQVEGAGGAWDHTMGDPNVVVAVIDTGIAHNNDLTYSVLPGYSFIYNSTDPTDEGYETSYHGTHVTGTIAANGLLMGMAPHSKVLPVQALGDGGSGYTSDIIDGMYWAAGFDVPGVPRNKALANIINLSLGSRSACSPAWQEAIDAMIHHNVTVVTSAGNSDNNVASNSPANCRGVIAVAATNRHAHRSYYSNYGKRVTIAAPGGEIRWLPSRGILSTVKDGYRHMQGTSMAAPHVSGVIALMLSVNPDLTPDQIKKIIISTATPFPADKPGYTCVGDYSCGAGVIFAPGAVKEAIRYRDDMPLE